MTDGIPQSNASHENLASPGELSLGVIHFLDQLRAADNAGQFGYRPIVWEPLGAVITDRTPREQVEAFLAEAQAKVERMRDELTASGYTFRTMHEEPIDFREGLKRREVFTAIGDPNGELAALNEVYYYGDNGATTNYRPMFWSSLGSAEETAQRHVAWNKQSEA
jgi:hypothetical protein